VSNNRDEWKKPRSHGQHLTEGELAEIKRAFLASEKIRDVARRLQCSSRVVTKYYGLLRAQGTVPVGPKKPLPDRFYKSSFEL